MINQFKFALKDLNNNISLVIMFMLQLFISLLFILLLSNMLIQEFEANKKFSNLYSESFYSLQSYQTNPIPIALTNDLDEVLSNTLNGDMKSYTVFNTVINVDDKEINIVIGLGGFGKIFNLYPKENNNSDLTVLLGSNVKNLNVGDNINIGTFSSKPITINDNLLKNSCYFDNTGIYNLDNSIVILSSWDVWKKVNTFDYMENILSNIKFIDVDKEYVFDFAQNISIINKNYDFTPIDNNYITEKKATTKGQTVFLVFFINIVIMICIGLFSNLMQLVDNNLREYSINRLYGSTISYIYLRLVIYISTILIIPFAIMIFIFKEYPLEMLKYIPLLFLILIIFITLSIITYPIIKLKGHSIPSFLRRDI